MTDKNNPTRRIRWRLWLIPGVLLLLPAYGFIYSLSHAYVSVSLNDVSATQANGRVSEARLPFLDANGTPLATAHTKPGYGSVQFDYPDFGDCARGKDERTRWQACNKERAKWFSNWANQLTELNLTMPDCLMRHVPVHPRVIRDMAWTWWVPHPEIGGTPDAYYSVYLVLDSRQCRFIPQK